MIKLGFKRRHCLSFDTTGIKFWVFIGRLLCFSLNKEYIHESSSSNMQDVTIFFLLQVSPKHL